MREVTTEKVESRPRDIRGVPLLNGTLRQTRPWIKKEITGCLKAFSSVPTIKDLILSLYDYVSYLMRDTLMILVTFENLVFNFFHLFMDKVLKGNCSVDMCSLLFY